MATAHDVAARLVQRFAENEETNDLTQLKLQKLLYYCQGYFLAAQGRVLFEEQLVAWEHGPVCVPVYEASKTHFGNGIYTMRDFTTGDPSRLSGDELEIVDEVGAVLGQFSAWRLRDMTHNELPWISAYKQGSGTVISHEDLLIHFRELV